MQQRVPKTWFPGLWLRRCNVISAARAKSHFVASVLPSPKSPLASQSPTVLTAVVRHHVYCSVCSEFTHGVAAGADSWVHALNNLLKVTQSVASCNPIANNYYAILQ